MNNLLTNAIKFTPEGGRVRVVAELEPDAPPRKDQKALGPFFRLIVEDTGIGIPLEEQATIFEKFRQGRTIPGQRDTMTREFGGTGLGLSIVKELSKLLGGEVSLESEFGKGSALHGPLAGALGRDGAFERLGPTQRPGFGSRTAPAQTHQTRHAARNRRNGSLNEKA